MTLAQLVPQDLYDTSFINFKNLPIINLKKEELQDIACCFGRGESDPSIFPGAPLHVTPTLPSEDRLVPSFCKEALPPAVPSGWLHEQRIPLWCKKPLLSQKQPGSGAELSLIRCYQQPALSDNLALPCYRQRYCCFPLNTAASVFIFFESDPQN